VNESYNFFSYQFFTTIVVKLFNAIRTQQKVTDVAVDRAASTSKTSRAIEKAKNGMCMSGYTGLL
jgi:hypothetical protein